MMVRIITIFMMVMGLMVVMAIIMILVMKTELAVVVHYGRTMVALRRSTLHPVARFLNALLSRIVNSNTVFVAYRQVEHGSDGASCSCR